MDIKFSNFFDSGFEVGFGNVVDSVSGNRLLVNRFEIAMFTNPTYYQTTSGVEYDGFGGGMSSLLESPISVNNIQTIAAVLTTCIDNTVQSIISTTPDTSPNTEKLRSAELSFVGASGDTVVATVNVVPMELESSDQLLIQIPISSRG